MFGDGEWHLYNVVDDPSEMHPLEVDMAEKFESMKTPYDQRSYKQHKLLIDYLSKKLNSFHEEFDQIIKQAE